MSTFDELIENAKGLPESLWPTEWTVPLLLIHSASLGEAHQPFYTKVDTNFEPEQSLLAFISAAPPDVFAFTKRSPETPFQDRIFVGRSRTNDVILSARGVSKLHCYFRSSNDSWVLADAGSKNGTFLSGERQDARKEIALEGSADIRIGPIRTIFLTPPALLSLLRRVT
ncbi:MAG: FHA domain-containing protein [Nannocystaceae bacterium]